MFSLVKEEEWKEFEREIGKVSKEVVQNTVDEESGDTLLHCAIRKSHLPTVILLLRKCSCNPTTMNKTGLTPLHLALMLRNRDICVQVYRSYIYHHWMEWQRRIPEFCAALRKIPDCEMEIAWKLSSWVPLLAMLGPKDVWRVRKKGDKVRIDFTFVGFRRMKAIRANDSFLFRGDKDPERTQVFHIFHDEKMYVEFSGGMRSPDEIDVEDDVDHLLEKYDEDERGMQEVVFNGEELRVEPKNGIFSSQQQKAVVCEYDTTVWSLKGVTVNVSEFSKEGNGDLISHQQREFGATLWMAEDFPIQARDLLVIFDVLNSIEPHVREIKTVLEANLPPGFPVKIDVPIFWGTSVILTFQSFKLTDPEDENFDIPFYKLCRDPLEMKQLIDKRMK